jgi:hypothetical protein
LQYKYNQIISKQLSFDATTSGALSVRGGAEAAASTSKAPFDIGLLIYFALWYLGNYYVSLLAK